jgi:hypothetical protein
MKVTRVPPGPIMILYGERFELEHACWDLICMLYSNLELLLVCLGVVVMMTSLQDCGALVLHKHLAVSQFYLTIPCCVYLS